MAAHHTHILAHTHTHTHTHTPHPQTQLIRTQLTHTYSSTHNLLHTNPSPSLFSFLLTPCRLCLSFLACWKKLTCGVIRSFNCFNHFAPNSELTKAVDQITYMTHKPPDNPAVTYASGLGDRRLRDFHLVLLPLAPHSVGSLRLPKFRRPSAKCRHLSMLPKPNSNPVHCRLHMSR